MFTHKLIGLIKKKKRINRRPPQNPIHVKALMATGFVPTVVEVAEEGVSQLVNAAGRVSNNSL